MPHERRNGSIGFLESLSGAFGTDFEAFHTAQHEPLPKTLRVNTLKNSVSEF